MCGIAGFYNPHDHYLKEKEHYESVLQAMAERLRHRGPDDAGRWLSEHGGLSHARLSIIDLAGGHQPMVKSGSGQTFAIVYNGELYNTDELRARSLWPRDIPSRPPATRRSYWQAIWNTALTL